MATRDRRLATFECAYFAASERRVRANDLWIAATAAAYELPLLTQDADFEAVNGVAGLTVIPV